MAIERMVCVIEIEKGSRNKYEWDEELGRIKLDRFLSSTVTFPTDYGYIPDAMGEDDDHLDVCVAVSEPTFPGCAIEARPIGVLRLQIDDMIESKILCVPCDDPGWNEIEDLDQFPAQLRGELEEFFVVYKRREGDDAEVDGWGDREAASKVIEEGRARIE